VDVSLWKIEQAKRPFNETISIMQRLDAQGQLEEAGQVGPEALQGNVAASQRADRVRHRRRAGLAVSFLRLRFTGWPLHPVMFLVWSTYAGDSFAQAFLFGWLIKVLDHPVRRGRGVPEMQAADVRVDRRRNAGRRDSDDHQP
jgi:hypothetical protein